MEQLSAREVEIIKCIASGYTAKEVARVIGLDYRTIEALVGKIKKKLGAKNITNAVYIAYDQSFLNHVHVA